MWQLMLRNSALITSISYASVEYLYYFNFFGPYFRKNLFIIVLQFISKNYNIQIFIQETLENNDEKIFAQLTR
jgi:hypothetical protein